MALYIVPVSLLTVFCKKTIFEADELQIIFLLFLKGVKRQFWIVDGSFDLFVEIIAVFTSIFIYFMRKYVAKEDVEKGLVDPTKSLEEQPEYKKKI